MSPGADGPTRCLDWAAAGRALPGEAISGDLAVHLELGDRDVVAVIDGLGHGPDAAHASAQAAHVIRAHAASEPIDRVMAMAHEELRRTRGATMTIASVDCDGGMSWVGVGDVEAHVVRLGEGHRPRRVATAVLFGGVVGYRLPRLRVSSVELEPDDLVVMATDGIAPAFVERVMVGDPLDRMVDALVARCARPTDDALVAAARYRGSGG